ncbi:hypothetical protein CPC08DRAFT_722055 [Agrocybe pediades]|nr:hypothetical protein CPC08DRAFT_722055 [Agrocybe pediades]
MQPLDAQRISGPSSPTYRTPKPTRPYHVPWSLPPESPESSPGARTIEIQRCTSTDSSAVSVINSSFSMTGDIDDQTSRTSSPDSTLYSKICEVAIASLDIDEDEELLQQATSSCFAREMTPEPPRDKAWAHAMRVAATSSDPMLMKRCMNYVSRSIHEWTEDDMIDLTRQLVWGASDPGIPNINDHFAALVVLLRDAFSRVRRVHVRLDERFLWHLNKSLTTTFECCWNDDSYKAVGSFLGLTATKTLERQVACALAQCKFIGSLYRQNILGRSCIEFCIGILIRHTTTLEYLAGLSNLLFQAGTKLWREYRDPKATIDMLKEIVLKAAEGIMDNRALYPNLISLKTTEAQVQHILSNLDDYIQHLDSAYVPEYLAMI